MGSLLFFACNKQSTNKNFISSSSLKSVFPQASFKVLNNHHNKDQNFISKCLDYCFSKSKIYVNYCYDKALAKEFNTLEEKFKIIDDLANEQYKNLMNWKSLLIKKKNSSKNKELINSVNELIFTIEDEVVISLTLLANLKYAIKNSSNDITSYCKKYIEVEFNYQNLIIYCDLINALNDEENVPNYKNADNMKKNRQDIILESIVTTDSINKEQICAIIELRKKDIEESQTIKNKHIYKDVYEFILNIIRECHQ